MRFYFYFVFCIIFITSRHVASLRDGLYVTSQQQQQQQQQSIGGSVAFLTKIYCILHGEEQCSFGMMF